MNMAITLPVPEKYAVYTGADVSLAIDSNGTIFYSCSATFPDKRFGQIVVQIVAGSNEPKIIDIEFVTGRGQLVETHNALYLIAWHEIKPKQIKMIKIQEYVGKTFTDTGCTPIPVPPARWVSNDPYVLTDELLRTKLRLTDTLVNALRDVLIQQGLAQ